MHTKEIAEARRRRVEDITETATVIGVSAATGAAIGSIGGPVSSAVGACAFGASAALAVAAHHAKPRR